MSNQDYDLKMKEYLDRYKHAMAMLSFGVYRREDALAIINKIRAENGFEQIDRLSPLFPETRK